jgi:hypothetical protein
MQSKLYFKLELDHMSTLCRFGATYRVITMSEKLYGIACEILVIKKEYFQRL